MSAWLQTLVGRGFTVREPRVDPGHLFTEIAPALARIPRFNGHTIEFYSVAQHSLLCAEAAEDETGDLELAAYCLLHDAHEAFVGDLTSPVQVAIGEEIAAAYGGLVGESHAEQFHRAWRRIKSRTDSAVHAAVGLNVEGIMRHRMAVRSIDLRALRTERDHLMLAGDRAWDRSIEEATPLPVRGGRIVPMAPDKAMAAFAAALQRLCPSTAAAHPSGW